MPQAGDWVAITDGPYTEETGEVLDHPLYTGDTVIVRTIEGERSLGGERVVLGSMTEPASS